MDCGWDIGGAEAGYKYTLEREEARKSSKNMTIGLSVGGGILLLLAVGFGIKKYKDRNAGEGGHTEELLDKTVSEI